MTEPALVFLAACLVNNLVADHLLGIGPLAAAEKMEIAAAMALIVCAALPLSVVVAWLLETWLLSPLHLTDYRLLLLVMTAAGACAMAARLLRRLAPRLFERGVGRYPLLLVNCALPGAALLNLGQGRGLLTSLAFGVGAGAGFSLVLLMFTAITGRLSAGDVPVPFRGLPLQLVILGIIALAFSGFVGAGAA